MEFVVDEIDVDVMAGFVIVDNEKEYDCSLLKGQIVDTVVVNHVKIPLQSVALWRKYYKLMHRDTKVAMNPWNWNGIDGLLGSFLGTGMLIPFVIAMVVMLVGLFIGFKEAYGNGR